MEFNARALVNLVHRPKTRTVINGYFYMKDNGEQSYQKRWCVLEANLFYYFKKRTDYWPIGIILLEGCLLELTDSQTELSTFKMDIGFDELTSAGHSATESSVYLFGAETEAEAERCLRALTRASDFYLKTATEPKTVLHTSDIDKPSVEQPLDIIIKGGNSKFYVNLNQIPYI